MGKYRYSTFNDNYCNCHCNKCLVSRGLWNVTNRQIEHSQKAFINTHRPYVGIRNTSTARSSVDGGFLFSLTIYNFGPSPGNKLKVDWDALINSVVSPSTGVPQKEGIIFPGHPLHLEGSITKEQYDAVMKNMSVLELKSKIYYEGLTQEKYHCFQSFRYIPDKNAFSGTETDCN